MPSYDALTKGIYTPLQWLYFYKNLWTRNLIARTIDVQNDAASKAKNAGEMVPDDVTGEPIPVSARLERRKIVVQDALDLLVSIDAMIKVIDEDKEDFTAKFWSPEALQVAEDMLPKKDEEKTGVDATGAGTPGADDKAPEPADVPAATNVPDVADAPAENKEEGSKV